MDGYAEHAILPRPERRGLPRNRSSLTVFMEPFPGTVFITLQHETSCVKLVFPVMPDSPGSLGKDEIAYLPDFRL